MRARVASLLFFSGACALVYQTTWLREFRLVFGGSTPASAAVLAIFIAGLGLGSRLFGGKADRHPQPLLLYAALEAGIAVSAAISPLLLVLVRLAYVAVGGTETLGSFLGGGLRLLLSALVLAVPTLLMGGTLPAAARFLEVDDDAGRRRVALLYGVNTLGAVAGAFLSTFVLLERLGNRRTLLVASLVNLLIAVVARSWARDVHEREVGPVTGEPGPAAGSSDAAAAADRVREPADAPADAPAGFVLASAALVGFAFFLLEMIWYRMLAPLLGGSVFTFGLILSLALLGIGIGGAMYALLPSGRPSRTGGFAVTCLLEAACVGLPLAMGDRLAAAALLLRPLGDLGLLGHVIGWSLITAVVVFPASVVAGAQFPMLIALLGRGRHAVGRHIGLAYLWNTGGAIVGSLAGGFGLLPALGAVGCWRLVTALLGVLGLCAVVVSLRRSRLTPMHAVAALLAVVVAPMVAAAGPSAAWRHSGIGAGRARTVDFARPNGYRYWLLGERWSTIWERDGVESSVSLKVGGRGMSFVVNGKSDGHATADAPTQVMSGLLAAALRPGARSAMIVGLGTGSTGGWLALVPGMERVDVVELEPAILEVARACSAVNADVLSNPRVHLRIGDAREVLLTTPARYDLIFSEPSNPYRSGIASLFTLDFYRAVSRRLNRGGVFVQWVQSYEVDAATVLSIYSTLSRVFPYLQVWRTHGDLLLVVSESPLLVDARLLRARLASEPWATALRQSWRATELEDVLARFVAGEGLSRAVATLSSTALNTDDRNAVEFGFARTVGRTDLFTIADLYRASRALGVSRPTLAGAETVDWDRVDEQTASLYGGARLVGLALAPDAAARVEAVLLHADGDLAGAARAWLTQSRPPRALDELVTVAESLAATGRPEAQGALDELARISPDEAHLLRGVILEAQGAAEPALASLERGFVAMRRDPWCEPGVAGRALAAAGRIAGRDGSFARRLYAAIREPFAARAMEAERVNALTVIGIRLPEQCADLLSVYEPNPSWNLELLDYRLRCYAGRNDPRAEAARRDLAAYLAAQPLQLEVGLRPRGAAAFGSVQPSGPVQQPAR